MADSDPGKKDKPQVIRDNFVKYLRRFIFIGLWIAVIGLVLLGINILSSEDKDNNNFDNKRRTATNTVIYRCYPQNGKIISVIQPVKRVRVQKLNDLPRVNQKECSIGKYPNGAVETVGIFGYRKRAVDLHGEFRERYKNTPFMYLYIHETFLILTEHPESPFDNPVKVIRFKNDDYVEVENDTTQTLYLVMVTNTPFDYRSEKELYTDLGYSMTFRVIELI